MNSGATKSILIVDDQVNWLEAIRSLLRREGRIITVAANFQEAMNAMSQQAFDLAILDLRLVDEDIFNVQGIELLRIAKAKTVPPKVMILTGYAGGIRKEILDEYGADALVLKVPVGSTFDTKRFKKQVEMLLDE